MELNKQVEIILQAVSEHTKLTPADILSTSRKQPRPYARKLAIVFIRNVTNSKCKSIAEIFGWPPRHYFVSDSYNRMMFLQRVNKTVRQDIEAVSKKLESVNYE
jgi:chromosomal replication initiation ATPase DnaA